MRNILRSKREEIHGLLCELELGDLRTLSEEEAINKIDKIESLLRFYGIAPSSDYYKRLQDFCDRADKFFSSLVKREGIRDYAGMSGRSKVRVKFVYDHLFFERVYGGRVKISWRFNSEGRLDLLDAMTFPQNDIWHLIAVENFSEPPYDWQSKRAKYNLLPRDVYCVNPGFLNLGLVRQYKSLMRFGHSMSKDLLENLEKGDIRDSNVLQSGQKQLIEIANDAECLGIVKNAGLILPYIAFRDKRYLTVEYWVNEGRSRVA